MASFEFWTVFACRPKPKTTIFPPFQFAFWWIYEQQNTVKHRNYMIISTKRLWRSQRTCPISLTTSNSPTIPHSFDLHSLQLFNGCPTINLLVQSFCLHEYMKDSYAHADPDKMSTYFITHIKKGTSQAVHIHNWIVKNGKLEVAGCWKRIAADRFVLKKNKT